ncbi:MAG: DUF3788 domain-containing protein, partial [Promethearchaeota archaeon]
SQRMIDKTHMPSEEEMVNFIGDQAKPAWLELRRFIEDNYDVPSETVFYGVKYGWTVRFRKSGKTLCSFFPEKGGFTILVTLGRKESEKALLKRDELSSRMNELVRSTEQLHDGRWLWIKVSEERDTDDIKQLLRLKRRPKKR